ncbi:MAG TPA: rod-binding protein [Bryobacteraceae bacterium]|nr:rod-binding protein [Bryobacteraceae bacterium]
MDQPGIALLSSATAVPAAPRKTDSPARIRDAAQQFEALLINQILHSARESGGWLSLGDDPSGDSATDFAEQQLADTLAKQGGFGLSKMIADGLQREDNK